MTPVAFAIFTEFLILATLGFLLLWSLEILLPTFVSARINLPLYLGGILSLFILHHAISVWLPQKINPLNRPLRWFLIIFLGFLSIILPDSFSSQISKPRHSHYSFVLWFPWIPVSDEYILPYEYRSSGCRSRCLRIDGTRVYLYNS